MSTVFDCIPHNYRVGPGCMCQGASTSRIPKKFVSQSELQLCNTVGNLTAPSNMESPQETNEMGWLALWCPITGWIWDDPAKRPILLTPSTNSFGSSCRGSFWLRGDGFCQSCLYRELTGFLSFTHTAPHRCGQSNWRRGDERSWFSKKGCGIMHWWKRCLSTSN